MSEENNKSTAPRVQGVLNKCDLLMKRLYIYITVTTTTVYFSSDLVC